MSKAEIQSEPPELTPASENIWYVLATIAGEPKDFSDEETAKNRRYWNGYMALKMSKEARAKLKTKKGEPIFLPDLSKEEQAEIRTALDKRGFKGADLPHPTGGIYFMRTEFPTFVNFSGYFFSENAFFDKATFPGDANFSKATFSGYAGFEKATFPGDADFSKATFSGKTVFRNATFSGDADFTETDIKAPTKFTAVAFAKAPLFYATSPHEDTDWTGVKWPDKPTDRDTAVQFVRRYDRLALIMNKLQKHEDEHRFFRLAMRAKRVRDGWWTPSSLFNMLYGWLFDYGHGFTRALGLWLFQIAVGALLISAPAPGKITQSDMDFAFVWEVVKGWFGALPISFANSHSFLGLNRGALEDTYETLATGTGGWLPFETIWGVQTIIGVILLFFLLLTIRNKFRMR